MCLQPRPAACVACACVGDGRPWVSFLLTAEESLCGVVVHLRWPRTGTQSPRPIEMTSATSLTGAHSPEETQRWAVKAATQKSPETPSQVTVGHSEPLSATVSLSRSQAGEQPSGSGSQGSPMPLEDTPSSWALARV